MSLNHVIYPVENQDERLNIDVCDIYACNIFSDNPPIYDNIEIRQYEQLSPNVVISNGDPETSLFNTTGAIGTNLIQANTSRTGTKYKIYSNGKIETAGANKDFIITTKLGTAILESETITLPNLNFGSKYSLNGDILIYQSGNAGTAIAKTFLKFEFTDTQGLEEGYFIDATNNTTFQTTTDEILDITIEWIAPASVSEIFECGSLTFSKTY